MKAELQTWRSQTKTPSSQAVIASKFRFGGRSILLTGLALMLLVFISAESRAQSALDGFDPGANYPVNVLAVQADDKILVGGDFTSLGGGGFGTTGRNFIGRLNADGTLDTSFHPGANGAVYALAVQADGKILVGGNFTTLGGGGPGGGTGTTTRRYIGRLHPDGTLDATFNPGANDTVYALAVQGDGKILVAGNFTGLGGGAGMTTRNYIGRLHPDGTLDATFNPGANDPVGALAVQGDGKILLAGGFTTLGGGGTGTSTRNYIGRLNPNGSLDASFNPGANSAVLALTLQGDGKILVGGYFTGLGGGTGTTARNYIGRLNPNGTLDSSFDPGANAPVYALAVQLDGGILVGGGFNALGGGGSGTTTRNYIGRLKPNGSLDLGFNPGANFGVVALAVQAHGRILVGGSFTALGGGTGTTTRNYIGRLNPDGSLDTNFDHGANFGVLALALQGDGKILVGGYFTVLGGSTGISTRNYIGRLNANSTLDPSFDPGANNGVTALAAQGDGKILVAGNFTGLGGGTGTTTRNRLGRLNPDGSLDSSFDPGVGGDVYALALQADGKILVGGLFNTLGGGGTGTTTRNYIGRLHANGTLDTSFNPGANGRVRTLALQADGRILVGGDFNTLGGGGFGTATRNHIGRLNPDGSLDSSFNPGVNHPEGEVYVLAVQTDGKILVGGNFTGLGGGTGDTTRRSLGRVHPDGTVDTSFDPGANDRIWSLALQTDGKILVGGEFTTLGGGGTGTTTRSRIGRLHPDGSLDSSFDPGADRRVFALAVQADGKIFAAGDFDTLGGGHSGHTPRGRIGRLTNPDAAVQDLMVDPNDTTVTWNRYGASPEVGRVTFELSTDAINYTALPNPNRIVGGWQLTGQGLPTGQNIFVRARGFYSAGMSDSSGSIAETVRNVFIPAPLVVLTSVLSRKTHGGTPFEINLPLAGSPGIECRSGGASGAHTMVFIFAHPLTSVGGASVTSGIGNVSSSAIGADAHQYVVNLTGVANAQEITVSLSDVTDSLGNHSPSEQGTMGVLVGDTIANRVVNSSDIGQTKAQSGQPVTASNFRTDVNANGVINSSDISLVKSNSGTSLP